MLQNIQNWASSIESVCVLLGVIFAVWQIRQQTKIARADHDRQKKQSTIEFYDSLSSESYQFLDEIKGLKITLEIVSNDKVLRKSVIRYLSKLERLAVGVAADVYDFKILDIMSGRFLIKKHDQFKAYIDAAREAKKAPMLYKEFELLVEKLKKTHEDNPEQIIDSASRVSQP